MIRMDNGSTYRPGIKRPSSADLKEDLENDTVQYIEPPDLEDLLGEDWDEEQEDGPSIEM